ncbi:DUF393 domain-containing protein [Paenibacillus thiaminolyticus]|nr:DUF393 domain-containing protein [Paenibacillus thiaminolyticus]
MLALPRTHPLHDQSGREETIPVRCASIRSGAVCAGTHGLVRPTAGQLHHGAGAACYTKSEAALRACRELGGLWRLLYGCIAVPAPVRDWAYDFIAARRYRRFGRREACLLPVPELAGRWIETVEEVARDENTKQADLREA